ncbi:visual pigment-like receptor peropsin [Hydractinia symbiolongicarpus]|uniref:visual pigment-like receptor peropsin n=1 Tax=Hydractinia symbiolongicarpus TaxID=13093 RepID=UPI00254EF3D7|nr:visual pigment-like receptor peropsin [Hydractinia symbiolongicarpus]
MDRSTFVGLLFAIAALTFILNGLVIVHGLLNRRKFFTAYDTTLLFLMVFEFLQGVVGYPIELLIDIEHGGFPCVLAGYLITSLALASISLLVALALMRLISVMYPFKSRLLLKSKKSSLYFIVPSTLYGFAWGTFPLLGWSEYSPELNGNKRCSVKLVGRDKNTLSYLYALMISCYFIPLAVMCVSGFVIAKRLRKGIDGNNVTPEHTRKLRLRKERRTTLFLFVIIAAFLIAWTPYALMIFSISLGKSVTTIWLDYSSLLAKSSTFYNPLIYMIMQKRNSVGLFNFLTIKRTSSTHNRNIILPSRSNKIQGKRTNEHNSSQTLQNNIQL